MHAIPVKGASFFQEPTDSSQTCYPAFARKQACFHLRIRDNFGKQLPCAHYAGLNTDILKVSKKRLQLFRQLVILFPTIQLARTTETAPSIRKTDFHQIVRSQISHSGQKRATKRNILLGIVNQGQNIDKRLHLGILANIHRRSRRYGDTRIGERRRLLDHFFTAFADKNGNIRIAHGAFFARRRIFNMPHHFLTDNLNQLIRSGASLRVLGLRVLFHRVHTPRLRLSLGWLLDEVNVHLTAIRRIPAPLLHYAVFGIVHLANTFRHRTGELLVYRIQHRIGTAEVVLHVQALPYTGHV